MHAIYISVNNTINAICIAAANASDGQGNSAKDGINNFR